MSGCTAVQVSLEGKVLLEELCARHGISVFRDPVTQVITLRRGDVIAKALVGSDVVIVKGKSISVSAPVEEVGDVVTVPVDFERRIINLLIEKIEIAERSIYAVLVDAGHGGKDPGTIGRSGTYEKDVVLDICKRLNRALKRKGFEVVMTRERDKFITLERRTEIASRVNVDLFVSVHANSSPSRGASGVEVYSFRLLDAKGRQEAQRQKNYRILFENLEMKPDSPELAGVVVDMVYDYKRAESKILASYIAGGLSTKVRAKNRGMKRSGFFLLRNTLAPAVLVEVGFLSNSREERLLKTSSYRQKIADGIAESVLRYVNR